MQWWCSAQTAAWDGSWQPYPGVWIAIAILVLGYARLRRSAASGRSGRRPEVLYFSAGALLLWTALDWPLGALGAGYLASAHMLQFLLTALVAPPLLLRGVPEEAYRRLEEERPVLFRAIDLLTRPLVALAAFNLIVLVSHLPAVVDGLMVSQLGSLAIDIAWLGGGLLVWWPVLAPVPKRRHFPDPVKMGYLFVNTLPSVVVAAFLIFADYPLYELYELAPPMGWISTRSDQQVAGLLMNVGGGLIHWTVISLLFFRWTRREGDDAREGRPLATGKPTPRR